MNNVRYILRTVLSNHFILLCRVIESKNADYPVGTYVVGGMGWRSHSVCRSPREAASVKERMADTTSATKLDPAIFGDIKHSLALGVLGMPVGLGKLC